MIVNEVKLMRETEDMDEFADYVVRDISGDREVRSYIVQLGSSGVGDNYKFSMNCHDFNRGIMDELTYSHELYHFHEDGRFDEVEHKREQVGYLSEILEGMVPLNYKMRVNGDSLHVENIDTAA
jgi:hypothetical protein